MKSVLTNDSLIEIFYFLPIEGFYKNIPLVSKQCYQLVTNKIYFQRVLIEHKIPKAFTSKYYTEILKPSELNQINVLWKEQHPIYFHDLVIQKQPFSQYKYVTWRMDVIDKSFRRDPYSTLACIPVNDSKALFVNLYINDQVYETVKENFNFENDEKLFSNFIQVKGEISNVKFLDAVYVDLQAESIEFVVNIEKKISKLPIRGLNPIETPFELFYSRYKGRMIQWEAYIDEILSSNSLHLVEPNLTLYHSSNNDFYEGDLIEFKGRIGTLMSIFCDEVKIKKPISFFNSIQRELITLGASSGILYLFYNWYKKRALMTRTSQFLLCFVSLLGLQYNMFFDHKVWIKGIIDFILVYIIYSNWGKWSKKGTSLLIIFVTSLVNIQSIYEILKKTKRIKFTGK